MKHWILKARIAAVLLAFTAALGVAAQTKQGPIDYLKIVDSIGCDTNVLGPLNATHIVNEGIICAFAAGQILIPYEFTNNRIFENYGTIQSIPGVQFNLFGPAAGSASTGNRVIMDSFLNRGTVDTGFIGFGGLAANLPVADASYVSVWARDLRNHGILIAGSEGLIRLVGQTINLTNSATVIQPYGGTIGSGEPPFSSIGAAWLNDTTYLPAIAILDRANGIESITNHPTVLYDGETARSAAFILTNNAGNAFRTAISLDNPQTFYRTAQPTPSNFVSQGVFVGAPADFNVDVRWTTALADPREPGVDAFLVPVIYLYHEETDIITGAPYRSQVVIYDQTGRTTNFNTLANNDWGTLKPAPFVVSRSRPFGWDFLDESEGPVPAGFSTNHIVELLDDSVDPPILWTPTIPRIATNVQAGYVAYVATALDFPPPSPLAHRTNWIGRIDVFGDSVDMARARLRAEGSVNITTPEFLGSRRSRVDSPYISLNLGSSRDLTVADLVPDTINRTRGAINLWGAVWTNATEFSSVSTNATDPANPVLTTNTMVMDSLHHATFVDARGLTATISVEVPELRLRSPTTVQLDDRLDVSEYFQLDAPSLVLNGPLRLGPTVFWQQTNIFNLRNVTITPTGQLEFNSYDNFDLGWPDAPLVSVDNQGDMSALGLRVYSGSYTHSGRVFTGTLSQGGARIGNSFSVISPTATFTAGIVDSALDIAFTNTSVTISGTTLLALEKFMFDVDSLYDAGAGSENTWTNRGGIELVRPVARGDLLGTQIVITNAPYQLAEVAWASPRFNGGFTDNLAIGNLQVNGGFWSLVSFRAPTTSPTTIYVDLLELNLFGSDASPISSIEDLTNMVAIASNVTVVFADIRGLDAVGLTVDQLEDLVFLGGGRMRWDNYAGRLSSVEVTLPSGELANVNRLWSLMDDDNDDVPNAEDPDALGSLGISGLAFDQKGGAVSFSWNAPAGSTVQLERNANPRGPRWSVVKTFKNESNKVQRFNSGPLPTTGDQKSFYRLRLVK